MYFTLINDIKYNSDVVIYEPEGLPVELDLMSGEFITTPVNTPLVYTTNAKKGDEIRDFLSASFTLMSGRFLNLLKQSGVENIQEFPAIVKSLEDGYIWDNYFSVNILGMISCAVLSKSTYTEIMPGYYRFKELAIDATKINGKLMFRLKEHSPTIIIHRSVGKYIKDNDPDKLLKGWSVGKMIQ